MHLMVACIQAVYADITFALLYIYMTVMSASPSTGKCSNLRELPNKTKSHKVLYQANIAKGNK